MKTTSIEELKAIVERLETVILKDKNKSPFIRGFIGAIKCRLNGVIKDEEEAAE